MYNVAAVLYLQCLLHVMLFRPCSMFCTILYYYYCYYYYYYLLLFCIIMYYYYYFVLLCIIILCYYYVLLLLFIVILYYYYYVLLLCIIILYYYFVLLFCIIIIILYHHHLGFRLLAQCSKISGLCTVRNRTNKMRQRKTICGFAVEKHNLQSSALTTWCSTERYGISEQF